MSELTPLMKQYQSIKERHRDAIVLFRLGDFYEMFGEDAEKAAKILQIALTTRDKGKDNPLPMCGVPYFASETYIAKLIKAGMKVAVCEQMEDPKDVKGIVSREVVRVITAGTHMPENPKENAYLLSVFPSGRVHGIAAADVSTGEFVVFETSEQIEDEVSRFEPKEVLLPLSLKEDIHYAGVLSSFYVSHEDDWSYDYSEAYRSLLGHFRVATLEGYGCEGMHAAVSAAGALLQYLKRNQRELPVFKKITTLGRRSNMFIDAATQRNLELTHSLRDGSREETLLWALDETLTPMGGRFMRTALLRPLTDIPAITARHDAVEYLTEDFELLETLRGALRKVQDIERLSSRIASGTASGRDLAALRASLAVLPRIRKALSSSREPNLKLLGEDVSEFTLLKDLLEKSIVETPPPGLRDGGIIRQGYHAEIDSLRSISTTGRDFIADLETRERKRTGIGSLKVGYNKIFGYYIEVTKANLEMVPADYTRKQTLVGAERFVTPELKEYEHKVLGSEDRLKALEYEVFKAVLATVQQDADLLLKTAAALSAADFLASLAVVAKRHNYVRPLISEEPVIEISEGRHPVLERLMTGERFVPNNTLLDTKDCTLLILTGPNMAGKSTYMRQVALIAIMAQMGGFVPAAAATIGVCDRVFTRIGASDFLAKGQSTFMVEMIEAANILNNATGRSLIILDEVGRGTSTFDGISIAWAIAENILLKIRARTLFATHYNELAELALLHDGVKNLNVSVREWGDEIIFLRKIEEGPADKSYGIQVARLAGIPDSVIQRAKEVLHNLENEELNETGSPKLATRKAKARREQLDLFGSGNDAVIEEILGLDPERMTPQQARAALISIRKKLR
ncbi:MAG: DNA mismatch repair protein MutS [Thermodesulfovibrionales bacterium]